MYGPARLLIRPSDQPFRAFFYLVLWIGAGDPIPGRFPLIPNHLSQSIELRRPISGLKVVRFTNIAEMFVIGLVLDSVLYKESMERAEQALIDDAPALSHFLLCEARCDAPGLGYSLLCEVQLNNHVFVAFL